MKVLYMAGNSLRKKYILSYEAVQKAQSKRNRSSSQKRYLEAIVEFVATIEDVIRSGSFAECLAILKEGQLVEIELFARQAQKENVLAFMEMLEIGEVHYELLRDSPKTYRNRLAAGFQKRERIPPERIAPKDGMHHALASYVKHLSARNSPLLTDAENDLIAVMIALVAAMREKYYAMQCKAMGIDRTETKFHAGDS